MSVVIVAHGGGELVRRAIRAVEHDPSPPTREIIVVDSGRPDGPAAWLRAERPDITLIEPGGNIGFGAANNRGIERSTGRYVLLLNPDAFVDEGCVGELVRFLETHPTAVAVGPRLRFGDGRLQRSCRGFPSVYRVATEYLGLRVLRRRSPALNSFYCAGFAHDEARHVDWLTGACLLVRGAPLRGAGGFDEAFFLYSEEVDLLRRLADEGGETWFDPAAGAVHLWGGVTSNDPGPAFREQLRSHVRYLHKHSGPAAAKAVRLVLLAGLVLRAPRSPGYRQALRWLAARDVDALLAGT